MVSFCHRWFNSIFGVESTEFLVTRFPHIFRCQSHEVYLFIYLFNYLIRNSVCQLLRARKRRRKKKEKKRKRKSPKKPEKVNWQVANNRILKTRSKTTLGRILEKFWNENFQVYWSWYCHQRKRKLTARKLIKVRQLYGTYTRIYNVTNTCIGISFYNSSQKCSS